MKQPLVSVIVTTKNSARTIKKCLQSIQDQTYPLIEILLVDNYSEDKTVDIAKKFTKKIYSKGPERSTQRNFGVLKSRGEYVLFLDSDMFLDKLVISECIDAIHKKKVKGIYIPEHMIGKSYWARVRNYERSFYNGTVIDAVRFMAVSDFNKVKGFDENMFAGEDWDLDKRIRKLGKTNIINAPLFHDDSNTSFKKIISKKKYYAENLDIYIAKWGKNDADIKKQFGLFYRYFWVFVENRKWIKILSKLHLFIGIILLKIIIGLQYISIVNNKK